ncbi:FkbM family methyltransferase [Motilibacter rhizosphaerae]|uniref:FkbM family methyltransferase n=1 Tax=Motilibacter rhizosphaerae TaxID=598652 RepID=A0A4Q7NT82_9ACTN|nr:FkbM family methyltransferase [Motilibacter rhizosphaerae]RZS90204.1 FkbM family methyltransferase [Motilibacter rhizosphaerae]
MTAPQPLVRSLVPESAPVELVAYYDSFAEYYRQCELQTKRWYVRTVQPDWVLLDVGANVGVYSALFSRLAPQGHVHAFEPTATSALLRANLAHAGATNVTVHEVAVGASTGVQEEPIYRLWGQDPERQAYPFTTIDAWVAAQGLDRLDVLKIDVDGFDLEALRGAAATIERFDPWIVIELNHALLTRGQSVSQAMLWLLGRGYTEALCLDEENFAFKRSEQDPRGPRDAIAVRYDREPLILPPGRTEEPVSGVFAGFANLHNGAAAEGDLLRLPVVPTAGALTIPAQAAPSGPLAVDVELEVLVGRVSVACLADEADEPASDVVTLSAAPYPQTARVQLADGAALAAFAVAADAASGTAAGVRLLGLGATRVVEHATTPSPVMRADTRRFALDCALTPRALPVPGREIEILPVQRMAEVLGFERAYVPEVARYDYDVAGFKSEHDEAGLFRYLYSQLRPKRHLEFGTWEGFGAMLCAESCDAEVWTLNLPDGERDANGSTVYGAQYLPDDADVPPLGVAGDAGDRIGWRYRAAGYGDRVHQMLLDSLELDVREFGPGFFDSALVDGGHTPDVVGPDTDKALHLVRSGGAVIWHDFCPDPGVLEVSPAGRGVMQAWVENHDRWRIQLKGLYWLRPSWLLIGIKA